MFLRYQDEEEVSEEGLGHKVLLSLFWKKAKKNIANLPGREDVSKEQKKVVETRRGVGGK